MKRNLSDYLKLLENKGKKILYWKISLTKIKNNTIVNYSKVFILTNSNQAINFDFNLIKFNNAKIAEIILF